MRYSATLPGWQSGDATDEPRPFPALYPEPGKICGSRNILVCDLLRRCQVGERVVVVVEGERRGQDPMPVGSDPVEAPGRDLRDAAVTAELRDQAGHPFASSVGLIEI